jgi:hypothetical protein
MHQLTPSRPAQAHVATPVAGHNVDDGALDGADTPALLTTPLRDSTNDLSVTAFGATNSVCRQPQQAMHWSPYMEAKQPLTSRRWAATSRPRLTLSTTRTSCLAETAQIGTGLRAVQCGLGSARHVQPPQQQQQQEETKVEEKEAEVAVAAEAEEKAEAEAEAEEEEQEEDIGEEGTESLLSACGGGKEGLLSLTEQQEGPTSQEEACTRGPLGTETEQHRPNLQAQDLQQQRRQQPEESQEGREAGVAEEDINSHEERTVLTLQPSQTARTQQYAQAQAPEMTPTLPCAILAAVSVCAHQPELVYLVLTQTLPVLQ